MLGVAVSVAGSRKSEAGIVNHHRTEDNLIAPVHIHVGDGKVVETIAEPGRLRVVAVPAPALGELVGLRVHVECTELMPRVAAAS